MLYSDILTRIDSMLRQETESGDSADAEHFRTLRRSDTPSVANDVVSELLRTNQSKFTREVVIELYDSTSEYKPVFSGEYFYVDINDYVEGNILTIPERIYEVYAIMSPFGTAERTGMWVLPFDSTVSSNGVYCPSKRTIYNSDGWDSGDVFRIQACVFPKELKPQYDTVTLTGATSAGGYATFTFASNPGIERGDSIVVSAGATDYTGTFVVLHATATSLIISLTTTDVFVAGTLIFNYANQDNDIGKAYDRLFLLAMKKTAFSRVDKPINTFEFSEYMKLLRNWELDASVLNLNSKVRFNGFGFGR